MSSTMIGTLGAAFSVALMLGLWGEESYRRAGSSWWAPAALGLLRAEVTTVQGLMVLLVTRPVSWVPAAGLALVAVCSGVTRFVQLAQPEAWAQRRWAWRIPYAVLVAAWIGLVGVLLPVPGALGERLVTAGAVAAVMCVFFLGVRLLARGAASLNSAVCPSDYVATPVPERASRS